MKLYWRFKKNGKWTWKPVPKPLVELIASLIPSMNLEEE